METNRLTFVGITGKTIIVHTVTYFIVGFIAYTIFDYSTRFEEAGLNSFMRPTDHPLVAAGPLFQPIRGVLFGVVFYLVRDVFFLKKNGWLNMWIVLMFLGIFSTFGPTPGSVEGLIYTILPIKIQLFGLFEVLVQSFLLSFILFNWIIHPEKRWITWILVGLFVIGLLLSTLGLFAASHTLI